MKVPSRRSAAAGRRPRGVQRGGRSAPTILRGTAGAFAVLAAAAGMAACESTVTGPSAQETTVPSLQARATAPSEAGRTPEAIPTPAPSPIPAPPPAPATPGDGAAPAPDAGPGCTAAALDTHLGRVGGAAGSAILTLVFTNTSGDTCTMYGYPGVSYTGPDGSQVGAPAARSPRPEHPVPLAPGASASAQVRAAQVHNYPAERCDPTPVTGLRVYPPGETASVVLDHSTTGCAATGTGITQMDVTPVVAGADG